VAAALKPLDKDMVLEAPAFGTRSRGLAENEAALAKFFRNFPDYNVEFGRSRERWPNLGLLGDRTDDDDRRSLSASFLTGGARSCRSSFNSNSKMISLRGSYSSSICRPCALSPASPRTRFGASYSVRQRLRPLRPSESDGQEREWPMTFDPRRRAVADIKTELLLDMVVT
jgi:hypothetical protein